MVAKEFDSTTKLSISADSQNSRAAKVSYFYDPDIGSYYYGPGNRFMCLPLINTHSHTHTQTKYCVECMFKPGSYVL